MDDFVYWNAGDKRPAKTPRLCQWLFNGTWMIEGLPPKAWEKAQRRWPRPKPKAPTYKDLLKALCSDKVRGTIRVDGGVSVTALGELTKAQWVQLMKVTK